MEQLHSCMFSQEEDETGAASAAAVWELVSMWRPRILPHPKHHSRN